MSKHTIASVFVFSVFFAAFVAPARSQEAQIPDHLVLARVCVNEAGWYCFRSGDGLAIHEVLLRGASRNNISYFEFARRYCQRLFGLRAHDNRRIAWVAALGESGAEPQGWPTQTWRREGNRRVATPHAPWSDYRDRWMRVLEQARRVVAENTLQGVRAWSPCQGLVSHWGGSMDRARAERMGLREVECGDTRNDFYTSPPRDQPAGE